MTIERPITDDRDLEEAITAMVLRALQLATTWTRWDGQPLLVDGRDFTPHKAMRRIADHMVDHLAQLDSHLAGVESLPDEWHGSAITTPCDLAPFGEEDLAEARSRLTRLAQVWRLRLHSIPEDDLDRAQGDGYTPREMAFCALESIAYAEAIGDLTGADGSSHGTDGPSAGGKA